MKPGNLLWKICRVVLLIIIFGFLVLGLVESFKNGLMATLLYMGVLILIVPELKYSFKV